MLILLILARLCPGRQRAWHRHEVKKKIRVLKGGDKLCLLIKAWLSPHVAYGEPGVLLGSGMENTLGSSCKGRAAGRAGAGPEHCSIPAAFCCQE